MARLVCVRAPPPVVEAKADRPGHGKRPKRHVNDELVISDGRAIDPAQRTAPARRQPSSRIPRRAQFLAKVGGADGLLPDAALSPPFARELISSMVEISLNAKWKAARGVRTVDASLPSQYVDLNLPGPNAGRAAALAIWAKNFSLSS